MQSSLAAMTGSDSAVSSTRFGKISLQAVGSTRWGTQVGMNQGNCVIFNAIYLGYLFFDCLDWSTCRLPRLQTSLPIYILMILALLRILFAAQISNYKNILLCLFSSSVLYFRHKSIFFFSISPIF